MSHKPTRNETVRLDFGLISKSTRGNDNRLLRCVRNHDAVNALRPTSPREAQEALTEHLLVIGGSHQTPVGP
jgi:hypothetical protein